MFKLDHECFNMKHLVRSPCFITFETCFGAMIRFEVFLCHGHYTIWALCLGHNIFTHNLTLVTCHN